MRKDNPIPQKLWLAGAIAGAGILTYYLLRGTTSAKAIPEDTTPPQKKTTYLKRQVPLQKEAEAETKTKTETKVRREKETPTVAATQILTVPVDSAPSVPVREINKQEDSVFPLQMGSTGKEVERLQIWLLRNHGWQGEITKVFDAKTLALVQKSIQQDMVDKATYEKHQMGIPIHQQIPQ